MFKKLIKQLVANRSGGEVDPGYRMEAAGKEATIYVYDAIGGWYGVSAEAFVRDLNSLDAEVINLRINSPGGDVFEARAMVTAIKAHSAKVIAHIDGLAASAASYLALAADEVVMADGAFFMIHNAWTMALGNKKDLAATIVLLEKIDASIAADYQAKTGKPLDEINSKMEAETWFSASEALDYGFIDRVASNAKAENRWNFANLAYKNAPKIEEEKSDPVYDRAEIERRMKMFSLTAA